MHLEFTSADLLGVESLVQHWRTRGFEGKLDRSAAPNGFISLTTKNWIANDGSFVTIELHKVSSGKGFFGGQKSRWVSRLLTIPSENSSDTTTHGCFESMTQLHAFDRAIRDVGTFMSQTTLDEYLHM